MPEPLNYDDKQNGWMSYEIAVDALREIGVRDGRFEPRNPREEIQREEGPREVNELDVIKTDRKSS